MSDVRAVVTDLLTRIVAGEPERVGELFAEDVDWRLDWPDGDHPAVPWIRPRTTRADVVAHFGALVEFHLPAETGPPPRILVDGDDAVVLTEIRQVVRATGRPYTAMCALHLTVHEGVIVRYHVYEDSLSVALAFDAVRPA